MRKLRYRQPMHGLQAFLLIVIASVCSVEAFAQPCTKLSGKYTINKDVATGNRNFKSFNEATLALICGITAPVEFDVVPGTQPYDEQFTIYNVPGTSVTNTVTFNGNGAEIKFLSTSGTNRAAIKLDNAAHIIIDSFVINPQAENTLEFGYGIQILRNSDSNVIKRCHINVKRSQFEVQATQAIVVNATDGLENEYGDTDCDGNLITGNTINGGHYGVVIFSFMGYGKPLELVQNNKVTKNKFTGQYGASIYLFGCTNTLVDSNDVSGMNPGCNAIELSETCIKNTVTNNRIHDPFVDAAYSGTPSWNAIRLVYGQTTDGNESIVANNLIYNFRKGSVLGISLDNTSHVKVYHNTIVFDGMDATATGDLVGVQVTAGKGDIAVKNNIVVINTLTGGAHLGLDYSGPGPRLVSNRNDVYFVKLASTGSVRYGRWNSTRYNTVTEFQTGAGQDYFSVSKDPLFENAAAGNFSPTEITINNMGEYVNVVKDIKGDARNNNFPDIGAYEFLTPPCTPPAIAGTSTMLPAVTEICTGMPISLNLNGNNFGDNQTYQWQTSATETGTYANKGAALAYPAFQDNPTATQYYRAAVTCGTTTVYSNPIRIIVNPSLAAGTYTINKGQATGGTNFTSFSDAVLAMKCGVTGAVVFNVVSGSGPYTEQVIIPQINFTSKTNTVTFNGNGNILQYKSTTDGQRATLKLDGADYVILDNFDIKALGESASTDYGIGVQLINDADNNIIRNNKITGTIVGNNNRFAGIVMSGAHNSITSSNPSYCDSNLVTNNTITGTAYAIAFMSSTSEPAYNNKVTNNTVTDFYSYGMYFGGHTGLLVEGNAFSRPTRTGNTGTYGIFMTSTCLSSVINKNKIFNLYGGAKTASSGTAAGIYTGTVQATSITPNTVSNNLIYDFQSNTTQYGIYSTGTDYTNYYHNTIVLDYTASTATAATRGIFQSGEQVGLEFKNNLVVIKRGGNGKKYGIYISNSGAGVVASNNNYNVTVNANNAIGYLDGASYTTLKDWKDNAQMDNNSLDIDPVFKSVTDLTPTAQTLDNMGTSVGITTDVNGKTRAASKPDIGAIEFAVCTAFPAANVVTDSIAVCTGSAVTFNIKDPVTGNTYSWFNTATNGTAVSTGLTYTIASVTTPAEYYVEAVTDMGCVSTARTRVKAIGLDKLTVAPVVKIDTATTNTIVFSWAPVPGAAGYLVSRDGVNFIAPSSGATGLSHILSGLKPLDTASIVVKAIGLIDCQQISSDRKSGRTVSSQVFAPNTFSPNGDGHNEIFKIYSNQLKSIRLMIFNQWGEKVFETADMNTGWNGSYKGKPAPVGVYVYVASIQLLDGTQETKKGSLNLVR